MNLPRWQRTSINDRLEGIAGFIAGLIRMCIYIFLLSVTVRILWWLLVKIF